MHLLRQAIWGDISKHTAGKTGCENTSFQCFLCGYTWSNIIRINWNPEKRMSNTISTLRFLIIQETKNFQKKRIGRVHHIVVEIDFHFYCFITFRFALSLILCCQLLNHTFSPAHLCMVIHKQGVPKKNGGVAHLASSSSLAFLAVIIKIYFRRLRLSWVVNIFKMKRIFLRVGRCTTLSCSGGE